MANLALVVAELALGACGPDEKKESPGARIDQSALDRPFVAFTQPRLTLTDPERAVPTPVTVGSTVNGSTLSSEKPAIVEVRANGFLVPHQPGETVIHGTGGARLLVEVLGPETLEIRGALANVQPGDEVPLSLHGVRGELANEGIVWGTTDPNVARVVDGVLRAGSPGTCRIIAKRGPSAGRLSVTVGDPPSFIVTPARSRVHSGQLLVFDAVAGARPIQATWTATDEAVIRPVGANVFQAIQRGKSRVCASAFSQQVCANVEVMP